MLSLHVCLGLAFENSPSAFESFLCMTEVLWDFFAEPQTLWSDSAILYIFKPCLFFIKSLLESLSDVSAYNLL